MGFVFTSVNSNKNNLEDNEYIEKQRQYLEYINNHKSMVQQAFSKLSSNISNYDISNFHYGDIEITKEIWERQWLLAYADIRHHDDSKFDDKEFEPYRRKFYPTSMELNNSDETQLEVEELFDEAWAHHYKHNYHHPRFWCYCNMDSVNSTIDFIIGLEKNDYNYFTDKMNDEPITDTVNIPRMPLCAIIDMICDCYAMSKLNNNDLIKWWNNTGYKEERSNMNPETLKAIEDLLFILFGLEIIHPETEVKGE